MNLWIFIFLSLVLLKQEKYKAELGSFPTLSILLWCALTELFEYWNKLFVQVRHVFAVVVLPSIGQFCRIWWSEVLVLQMVIFLKTWLKFICMWSTCNPHSKPFLCFGDKPVTKYKLYWENCQSCSTELHRHLLDITVRLAVVCLTPNWVLYGHGRRQTSQCLAGEKPWGRLMWPD